jgi:hypothetical protein
MEDINCCQVQARISGQDPIKQWLVYLDEIEQFCKKKKTSAPALAATLAISFSSTKKQSLYRISCEIPWAKEALARTCQTKDLSDIFPANNFMEPWAHISELRYNIRYTFFTLVFSP